MQLPERFTALPDRAHPRLRQLRAYGGAPLPLPLQRAAAALWRDEANVIANRALYAGDGEAAALRLWREAGVRALPGSYLGRETPQGANPGAAIVRAALVADLATVTRGLDAIHAVLAQPQSAEKV